MNTSIFVFAPFTKLVIVLKPDSKLYLKYLNLFMIVIAYYSNII